MKVSPKKITTTKFGVSLHPSKVYEATKDAWDMYRVKVGEENPVYVIFEKDELTFK